MRWFTNLSLRQKLTSVFVLAALLTAGMSYSGFVTTARIVDRTTTTYNKDIIPLEYLNDISLAFLSIRVDLRDAVFAATHGDTEQMRRFHERAAKYLAKVEERSARYQEAIRTDEGKRLFAEYTKSMEVFKKVGVKVQRLSEQADYEGSVRAILTECIPAAEQVKRNIELLMEQKQRVAKQTNQENLDLLAENRLMQYVVIAVGFLTIIVLGFWLSGKIGHAVEATATSSTMISTSVQQLSTGMRMQSTQVSDIASSMEEMTATIEENTRQTALAASEAERTSEEVRRGGLIMQQAIHGMTTISDSVIRSSDTMISLVKSSEEIEQIIQVIGEIADQTNLLALNAAIEAARAGDQGRGFAVVADEVRKLAERTRKATKEIATMIQHMQTKTSEVMEVMNEGRAEAQHGRELAQEAAAALDQVLGRVQNVSDALTRLAVASEEQSKASGEISRSVTVISEIIDQSSHGVDQIAISVNDLHSLALSLRSLISQSSEPLTPEMRLAMNGLNDRLAIAQHTPRYAAMRRNNNSVSLDLERPRR